MGPTVVLVPVLGRPHRVGPLLEDIAAATDEEHRVLFVASRSDHRTRAELRALAADHIAVGGVGSYAEKINAGYRATDEPVLFMAADDLHFHPGWLTEALGLLDDRIEVVGTNDLGNPRTIRGDHSCHNLFTRRYIRERSGVVDEPDTVLHEGYRHAFVDDEFVGTAKHREAWAFAATAVVEHLHPFFGKGDMDRTYRLGQSFNAEGRRLHRRRRHLWT